MARHGSKHSTGSSLCEVLASACALLFGVSGLAATQVSAMHLGAEPPAVEIVEAGGPHAGVGVVESVDAGRSRVTIAGRVYRVTASTAIVAADGRHLPLMQLATGARTAAAEYQAVGPINELELVELRLAAR